MLRFVSAVAALMVVLLPAGCVVAPTEAGDDALTAVLGTSLFEAGDDATPPAASASTTGTPEVPAPATQTGRYAGDLRESGQYELFDLGPGQFGDRWSVSPAPFGDGPFVVAIFDAERNLLMRGTLSTRSPIAHVLREATPNVILGVMPIANTAGGRFEVIAQRSGGEAVAAPARQVVWLNFGGGSDVRVATRSAISFAPFDGTQIGEAFGGFTAEMKSRIVALVREDYAAYDVEIHTSDEGGPPAVPHSTVHFGGDMPGLLGLADSVDNYNRNEVQKAIVYVGTFGIYEGMRLSPEEMSVMVANVASHELGHLLGLYHTRDVTDVMDTTGSAWDLVADQVFARAALEPTVFAVGMSDSPRLLLQTVGANPLPAKQASWKSAADGGTVRLLRAYASEDLQSMCGTCRHLDETHSDENQP